MTRILGLCGSLRVASLNALLLGAIARVAPEGIRLEAYAGVGHLPLFNADLDPEAIPAVVSLRSALNAADGVLIASPEYAHGVSGVMKNALDWMVANETFVGKPVGVLNASPRASLAQAALRETLVTMSARVIEDACLAVPLLGSASTLESLAADPAFVASARLALAALVAAAERTGAAAPVAPV